MTRILRMIALVLMATIPVQAADQGNVDLPRFPSISPDGRTIIFTWRGDLWRASANGGQAIRLTSHPATERRSAWSADGSLIAFESDRTGAWNLFVMRPDGRDIRAVTDTDRSCDLAGFSPDGRYLYFDSSREGDVYRASRPYRVPVDGGPIERAHDAFGEFPQVSPDGGRLLFERGGSSWSRRHYRGPDARNVWVKGNNGFRELTTWAGNDGMARWINDDSILFASDREDDVVNLYVMSAAANGQARRITRFDSDVLSFDVARNTEVAVVSVWDRLYTVDLVSSTPRPLPLVLHGAEDERDNFEMKNVAREVSAAALSPDGEVVAIVSYGDVYVRHVDEDSPTRRVTSTAEREMDVAWSPDGEVLYISGFDGAGTLSIFEARVERTRSDLKEAAEAPEEEPAAAEASDDEEEDTEGEAADGDEEDGDGDDEDQDEGDDEEDEEKEAPAAERWHDALTFTVTPLVTTSADDRRPMPSPDGRSLAFVRSPGNLVILDLATGEERTLVEGWDRWADFAWSPDGHWFAYDYQDANYNSDIFVVPADGSAEPVNISMHPDSDYSPAWSHDGKVLAFLSDRINDESDVWTVYLDASLDALAPRDLEAYYEEQAKAAKKLKPLKRPDEDDEDQDEAERERPELDLADAYLRLRRITSLRGGEGDVRLTPSGEYIVFTAVEDSGLYAAKWDGSDRKRLGSRGNVQGLSLKGDKVLYLRSGEAWLAKVPGGDAERVSIESSIRVDLQAQNRAKFVEAARTVGQAFYDGDMKGLDWKNLSERYLRLAEQSRTSEEFGHVGARLLGELNASHLGIYPPGDPNPNARPNGRLGIDVTPVRRSPSADHAFDLAFRVDGVVEHGPAWGGAMALEAGDLITAIEFESFAATESLESALDDRVNEETVVSVLRRNEDGVWEARDLLLTPISFGRESTLRYDEWQRERARLVSEWSDGRIGYLHIRSMGSSALVEFERDLFAAAHGKEGLLVDVRNNGGGSTADRVLASLMVRPHAYCIPRGGTLEEDAGYPRDRLYIQRYTQPVNMLCNEKSFSNAEIVSHAFKTLERGNLVGQQTYGGVISTGGTSLVDDTYVRLPFRGWYLLDGTDMENNGAMPDIVVPQTPEDETADFDRQLKAATEDLMSRLSE